MIIRFDNCLYTHCTKNHQLVKRHLSSSLKVPRWLFSSFESILHFIFNKSGFIARNYWTGRLNERFLLYPIYNILIINVRYKIRRQFSRTPRRCRVNCFTANKYFFKIRLWRVDLLVDIECFVLMNVRVSMVNLIYIFFSLKCKWF